MLERVINTPVARSPRAGLSADLLVAAMGAAFNGLALLWAESGFNRPLDEMIRTCLAIYESIGALWSEPVAPPRPGNRGSNK